MKNTTKLYLFLFIFLAAFIPVMQAEAVLSPLQVSCYALPNPSQVNQTITFYSSVFGGDGNYTYYWSNDCFGSSSICQRMFSEVGIHYVNLNVFNYGPQGTQSGSASCSAQIINYNYPSCNSHAYRDCAGGSIYWFDSCGNRQDLYQNCFGANQTCQYGQCVVSNPYVLHHIKNCRSNNLYWYDSNGALQDLYKNCKDDNQCTTDSCSGEKCLNTIKCDGSTCAFGSADYITYCAAKHCSNKACESNLGENSDNCPGDCKVNNISVSFLGKKNADAIQWDKTIQIAPNSNIYFLANLSNNSNTQADNINISANMPSEIAYLGNLKADDVLINGDIVFGVNIGSIAAGAVKLITFEGKTQAFSVSSEKQGIITINEGGIAKTDTVTINFDPSIQIASVSSVSGASSFVEFLKRWYVWILVGIMLIFLFIVVFRRFSSNI